MAHKILIVDDETNMRELLTDLLASKGYQTEAAAQGEDALARCRSPEPPDLMLLDLRLPGLSGLEVLKALASEKIRVPVVMITAHGDVDTAVEALKLGAADFIVKPFNNSRLLTSIRQALETDEMVTSAGLSRPSLPTGESYIVGKSNRLLELLGVIEQVAGTDATILIQGESGTGKELVARAVHLKSNRAHRQMVSLNCAALPDTLFESELFGYERGAFTGADMRKPGKLEQAQGGTLFLDEIGDLSPASQAKLLRAIEEKKFSPLGSNQVIKADIRVIAATNRDLPAMVQAKAFREDLYFRLNVVPVVLPPLRERPDDIPALAGHFLEKLNRRHRKNASLPPETMKNLASRPWPGNIRELEHAIENYVLLGQLPTTDHVTETAIDDPNIRGGVGAGSDLESELRGSAGAPAAAKALGRAGWPTRANQELSGGPGRTLKDSLKSAERDIIVRALRESSGNKTIAAVRLGVSYKTLFNKIREHQIKVRSEIE